MEEPYWGKFALVHRDVHEQKHKLWESQRALDAAFCALVQLLVFVTALRLPCQEAQRGEVVWEKL